MFSTTLATTNTRISTTASITFTVTITTRITPTWWPTEGRTVVFVLVDDRPVGAIALADIVVARSDPRDVAVIVHLAKKTYATRVRNLWWATGYNAVTIPLAAGVLAPVGIILPPAVGALVMSLSTVIVAVNARLLRLRKPGDA